jgi:predicted phage tail protein
MTYIAGAGGNPAGGGGVGKGGGGGGGGGASVNTPTEAKDSLDSTAYANIIDLLCEGEIEGFATPSKAGYARDSANWNKALLKDVFANDTPILRESADVTDIKDTDYNFTDFQISNRYGTNDQDPVTGFDRVETEVSIGVEVQKDTPITRTITDTDTDTVRVTISLPALQQFTDQGDIIGTSVQLQIQIAENGGAFATVIEDKISGRTGDLFQRDYEISLVGRVFPIDVRVVRVTKDSTSSKLANLFNWASYTQIVSRKMRYPNSAYTAIRISAEQFSNIPSRSYRIRGLKIQLPSNATVDIATGRVTYAGVWNGTFGAAQWCADPAWCLYALLTNTRWGFGQHIDAAQIDKWSFYQASIYANELVDNGFGGQEPRFQCNVNIQTLDQAYNLINELCSVFRSMPFWNTGTLTIAQDSPQDATYQFNQSNVINGEFGYSTSDVSTRFNSVTVSYFDMGTRDTAFEIVEDVDLIAKYGFNSTEITAFACTSRGQARRLAKWLIYSNQYEAETITFATSIDAGTICRPGQIIEVADPMRAGSRRGGRISSATTTTVTVDNASASSIPTTSTPTLAVILPDGRMESRPITAVSNNTITVDPAFSEAPAANSIWIAQNTAIQTSTWRVLAVTDGGDGTFGVTALAYNSSKYAYVEDGEELQVRDITDLNIKYPGPANLTHTLQLYNLNGQARVKIVLNWESVTGSSGYKVRYRADDDNWSEQIVAKGTSYEILDARVAIYEIEVWTLNAALLQTGVSKLTLSSSGKSTPPADVTGLTILPADDGTALLRWNLSTDLDVVLGGNVLIRHSSVLSGAVWEESQSIVDAVSGNSTERHVALLEGTYLLKFADVDNNRSVNAATVVVDLPAVFPRLSVTTYSEDTTTPPFQGNATNMFYSSELDGLILDAGDAVDDMAVDGDWDALPSIDGVGGVVAEGEYEFGSTFDMGARYDVNLQRRFVTRPYLPSALWDDKFEDIDLWASIDEDNLDKVDAKLYVRSTDDNPSGTPTWGNWNELVNGVQRGRGFQFKTLATSTDTSVNIVIDELGAVMELQQHTEQSASLSSGAGTYTATFANAFYQAPAVAISPSNLATGDFLELASITRTGFQVTFKNSAGTAVSRSFTYVAVGYGREV